MPTLNLSPTKSNLLGLKQQLAIAEEGFDLLEQKRQVLALELMKRLARASEIEQRVTESMRDAFAALTDATLDLGSNGLERAALAVRFEHQVELTEQRLMGMNLPRVHLHVAQFKPMFGVVGTSASTDVAMRRFLGVLPQLGELAELETAVLRLARELRKTQRRCNALSKILIPNYQRAIKFIGTALEEREREAFVIHKMIRDRLGTNQAEV